MSEGIIDPGFSLSARCRELEAEIERLQGIVSEHSCAAGVDPCCCPCLKTWMDAAQSAERQRDEAIELRDAYSAARDVAMRESAKDCARADEAIAALTRLRAGVAVAWRIAKDRRDRALEAMPEAEAAERDLAALQEAGFADHLPTIEEVRAAWRDEQPNYSHERAMDVAEKHGLPTKFPL